MLSESQKERNRESVRRYREKNKELTKARNMAWRHSHYIENWHARISQRAKKLGIDFDLTLEDFEVPDICPALGTPIIICDPNKWQSPSIDRIDPTKGYVKGNIRVVSFRANQVKSNSTIEEMEKVLQYYKECELSRAISVPNKLTSLSSTPVI